MSIPLQGSFSRPHALISAIAKQLRLVNFKPVNKITIQFDPFEKRVRHARDLLFYFSAPKLQATNLSFVLKSKIVCDRSEPTVTCDLASGDKIVFKCANLDTIDILKLYNQHISSLVPVEAPVETGKPKRRKKLLKNLKNKVPRHRQ